MSRFSRRLLRAVEWGAVLALSLSCGQAEREGESGSGGSGGATGLPTEPYPTPAGCFGPVYDGGYYGQCCEKVICTPATDGACPPVPDPKPDGWPTGSGVCSCSSTAMGPYAPQKPTAGPPCCYIWSTIGCDGRPLIVRGEPRLAPLRRRADWACPPRVG